jgi:hypothetical protein
MTGGSELHFEAPDLIILRVHGKLREPEAVAICEKVLAHTEGRPPLYIISDVTRLEGIDSPGRRELVKRLAHVSFRSAFICGTTATTRAMLNLIIGAATLFRPTRLNPQLVATEEEARARIDAHRAQGAP